MPTSAEETDVNEGRLTSPGPWRCNLVQSNSILGCETKLRADGECTFTMEERAILAWERIADELTLLNQSFEHFLDRDAAAPSERPEGARANPGLECSDNGTAPSLAADHGSYHPSVEGLSVAGHNYPDLQRGFKHSVRGCNVAEDAKGDD